MNAHTLSDLDRTDRKILEIFQRKGLIANADLAKKINLSATPTLERVRRLEHDGSIDKYVAVLSAAKMEIALIAFVEITLDPSTEDVLENFAEAAQAVDEIVECQMVAGGFDYLKVRVRDIAAYRRFLGASLANLLRVRQTHTYVAMEEVKAATVYPVGLVARH